MSVMENENDLNAKYLTIAYLQYNTKEINQEKIANVC